MASKPPPSAASPELSWLNLKGKRTYMVGEKGSRLQRDPGTFKALREPSATIDVRGLYGGGVNLKPLGKLICPENSKTGWVGGLDGGVRRSLTAWEHKFQFVQLPWHPG